MLLLQFLVQGEELQAIADAVGLAERVDRDAVPAGRDHFAARQGCQRFLPGAITAGVALDERVGIGAGHSDWPDREAVRHSESLEKTLRETMVISRDLLLDVFDQLRKHELDGRTGAEALRLRDAYTEPAVESIAPPVVLAEDTPQMIEAVFSLAQSPEEHALAERPFYVIRELRGDCRCIQHGLRRLLPWWTCHQPK